jgi:hypothetical protein
MVAANVAELRFLVKMTTEFHNVRPLTFDDERKMCVPDLFIDNTGTIATSKRGDRSAKIVKSMALREHWIMTEYEHGRLNIDHVRSKLNKSDLHTKCLAKADLYFQMHLLDMRRIVPSQDLEGNAEVFIIGTTIADL